MHGILCCQDNLGTSKGILCHLCASGLVELVLVSVPPWDIVFVIQVISQVRLTHSDYLQREGVALLVKNV